MIHNMDGSGNLKETFGPKRKKKKSGKVSPRKLFKSLNVECPKNVSLSGKMNLSWKPPLRTNSDNCDYASSQVENQIDQGSVYESELMTQTSSQSGSSRDLKNDIDGELSTSRDDFLDPGSDHNSQESTHTMDKECKYRVGEQKNVDLKFNEHTFDSSNIDYSTNKAILENYDSNKELTADLLKTKMLNANVEKIIDDSCALRSKTILIENSGQPFNEGSEQNTISEGSEFSTILHSPLACKNFASLKTDDGTKTLNEHVMVTDVNMEICLHDANKDIPDNHVHKFNKTIMKNDISRKEGNFSQEKSNIDFNVEENVKLKNSEFDSLKNNSPVNTSMETPKDIPVANIPNTENNKVNITMNDGDKLGNCDPFFASVSNSQFLQLESAICNSEKEQVSILTIPEERKIDLINKDTVSFSKKIEWQKTILKRVIADLDEMNKAVAKATMALRNHQKGLPKQ